MFPNLAVSFPLIPTIIKKMRTFLELKGKLGLKTSNPYPSQMKLHKQWEEEIERLNTKYNLDCFSDSELDSESDEGEEYKYEHNYKTLL